MQRVLLLEDHHRLAALVRQAIEGSGLACDTVERLGQAWAALEMVDYAVAIIDRGLPDGDGLELVRRLRAANRFTPCLILTARDALHDRFFVIRKEIARWMRFDDARHHVHAKRRRFVDDD